MRSFLELLKGVTYGMNDYPFAATFRRNKFSFSRLEPGLASDTVQARNRDSEGIPPQ